MATIISFLKQLFSLFKEKALILFQVIAAFLLPIQSLIILVGMMIFLDTATGIWKAKKANEPITSHKLSRVISKMLLYQVSIISFFALEKFLLMDFVILFTSINLFLTKVVAIFFCGIEALSINENIKSIYGVNLFQTFKKMLFRVKDFKDDIEEFGEKKKKDGDGMN
jgi:hypothetical protein